MASYQGESQLVSAASGDVYPVGSDRPIAGVIPTPQVLRGGPAESLAPGKIRNLATRIWEPFGVSIRQRAWDEPDW